MGRGGGPRASVPAQLRTEPSQVSLVGGPGGEVPSRHRGGAERQRTAARRRSPVVRGGGPRSGRSRHRIAVSGGKGGISSAGWGSGPGGPPDRFGSGSRWERLSTTTAARR